MTKLAIITARGGSKRIPRKNIKPFRGKPVIAYSIESALQSGLFDMVLVSTDDQEIADISKQYGAEVPFFRNAKTADDFAGTADVLLEVIEQLKEQQKTFDCVCCIYPTAPFISPENLNKGFEQMQSHGFSSVFPVCRFSYPIYRGLQFGEAEKIEMLWPENLTKRSQDLPEAYHDAGQFYWLRTNDFLKEKILFTSNSGAIVLNELEVQDIDNETDWKLAELKHSLLYP